MDGKVLELDKTSCGQENHGDDADHIRLAQVNSKNRIFQYRKVREALE
jgi:hypothetical protein